MPKKTSRRDALDMIEEAQERMEAAAELLERATRLQDRALGILDGDDDPALEDEAPTWGDVQEAVQALAEAGPERGEEAEEAAGRIMDLIEDLAAEGWPDEPPGPDQEVPEWVPNRVGETLAEWAQRKGDIVVDRLPEIIAAILTNLRRPADPPAGAQTSESNQNPPSGTPPRTIHMKRVG